MFIFFHIEFVDFELQGFDLGVAGSELLNYCGEGTEGGEGRLFGLTEDFEKGLPGEGENGFDLVGASRNLAPQM